MSIHPNYGLSRAVQENETAEEAYKRTYNQTKDLYNELIKAIKKTKSYSKEAIDKHKSEE